MSIKHDNGKPKIVKGLLQFFPLACGEVAKCSEFGGTKYSWEGWSEVENGIERYSEAMARHLSEGGGIDEESGLLSAAHVAWNAMAVLELRLREKEGKDES